MECTKVNCPMQAGTPTSNCGENCPWRTTAKTGDLISRAAAIEAMRECWRRVNKFAKPFEVNRIMDCINAVKELPAVDAVPVVRCKDCKFGNLCFDADGHHLIQCTNTNYPAANVETWPLELDWYCAGGERRDGDT